jgi:pyruvate formate lyase activating enzyme
MLRLENRCMACGRCGEEERAGSRIPDPEALAACPTGALQRVGEAWEPAALAKELLRDRIFFDQSGGGVTFSGGEPLLQAPFLIEVLERLGEQGVSAALDTCGFAPWKDLHRAASLATLILYDLKMMDDARHREATGQSNRIILDNLRALAEVHPAIRIRVPVIPGVNDDDANLEAMARFLSGLPGIRQVDLLPYHRTGQAKFARLGMTYALPGIQPPTAQRLETLAAVFRARGLNTPSGGHP